MVSVVIPVFNAELYLKRALESMLSQTLNEIEIICIDDGSTDDSLKILQEFQAVDDRLIVVSQANAGAATARNLAIEMARAEFVATLDADDYCSPHRLETQLEFLQRNPECVAVGSFAEIVDEYERSITVVTTPTEHSDLDTRAFKYGECAMCGPALMYRRSALIQVGGYREQYNFVEDFDLFFRLAEVGKLACLPDVLYYYRQLPTSICRTKKKEQRILIEKCIQETCQRRGLGLDKKASLPRFLPYEISTSRHYVNVAVQSILGGNPKTAQANAFRALQHQPWHPFPWAAFALSFMPSSVTRSLVQNVFGRDV
ncbi:glycosyltransferase family 2 protein [Bremerella alba]|nr:glycosyltransferase [Bremerella alba]